MTKNILVVTSIFPPDIGGPATYVPQIAAALTRKGHRLTVLTLSDTLEHDDSSYPFQVFRLPRQKFKPWRWLATVLTILHLGRQTEVLFVNGLALEAAVANLFLRQPLVMKVVGDLAWELATRTGWISDDFEAFQRKRYDWKIEALKALRSWWTRQAHRIIVPSRYLARWVAGWGVKQDRIAVIYNAVKAANGIIPAQVPLTTPVKAVTVGRLVPWKRLDHLIEALARLPDLGAIIIGEGPERSKLERLACSLKVNGRLYFAGPRTKAETLSLMAAADLFVLNSSYEGLPHVILEALGLGLPVVATAVGGTPEVVQDGKNGRLISPLEKNELFEALSDPSQIPRRQLRTREMDQAPSPFGLRQMFDQTAAILADLNP